jgi:small subunit ribosomal protein S9
MADEPTEHTDEQSAPTEPTPDAPMVEDASAEERPEQPTTEGPTTEEPTTDEPVVDGPVADESTAAEQPVAEESGAVEQPVAKESGAEQPAVEEAISDEPTPVEQLVAEQPATADAGDSEEEEEEPTPRVKPSVPGAHLEVDIVPEGVDPLAPEQPADPYALEDYEEPQTEEVEPDGGQLSEPISTAAIDLAAGARYKATGKRKTAIARVILRPGTGAYLVNGRPLDEHFPRATLQRNIRQPLETVGYQDRMDVVARLHGGGISAQAGALRHGISRALLEADPNLRGELKRRGFLTRDSRAKERKKAGLKKARKRPQFSKR